MTELRLLPQPRRLLTTGGTFTARTPIHIDLDPRADPGSVSAMLDLVRTIRATARTACSVAQPGGRKPSAPRIHLRLHADGSEEAYAITVRPRQIEVEGRGHPGLFYGIQTLIQLFRACGGRPPCLRLSDAPAFPHRGFYHDITRGKVPTLDTLFDLVDRLAALKVNQLQLYVEHVFDFSFDRSIGAGCDPLTPEDVLRLDAYCTQRHIRFIPSLACFGHMGRILSLPRYRALAEVEWPARDWASSSWLQRLRGATLDPRQPASRRLIRDLLDEFLPLFSQPFFNMCGDETYDLGRGRNAARAARTGIAALYIDHLRFVREIAARHGKRLMFWGDVMQHHPEAIRRLPRDGIVLDWGYEPNTPFEKIGRFLDARLEAYACPATRGFRSVFNEIDKASANISGYARTARRLGAAGLLTTDWGDMGHFNMLACSLHGLALGAGMAWNPDGPDGPEFDRAFSLQCFGDASGSVGRLYRAAGNTGVADLYTLIGDKRRPRVDDGLVSRARQALARAGAWESAFKKIDPPWWARREDARQLALASRAVSLNARKILLEQEAAFGTTGLARRWAGLADDHDELARRLRGVWLASNRPSELPLLEGAIGREASRLRALARR